MASLRIAQKSAGGPGPGDPIASTPALDSALRLQALGLGFGV